MAGGNQKIVTKYGRLLRWFVYPAAGLICLFLLFFGFLILTKPGGLLGNTIQNPVLRNSVDTLRYYASCNALVPAFAALVANPDGQQQSTYSSLAGLEVECGSKTASRGRFEVAANEFKSAISHARLSGEDRPLVLAAVYENYNRVEERSRREVIDYSFSLLEKDQENISYLLTIAESEFTDENYNNALPAYRKIRTLLSQKQVSVSPKQLQQMVEDRIALCLYLDNKPREASEYLDDIIAKEGVESLSLRRRTIANAIQTKQAINLGDLNDAINHNLKLIEQLESSQSATPLGLIQLKISLASLYAMNGDLVNRRLAAKDLYDLANRSNLDDNIKFLAALSLAMASYNAYMPAEGNKYFTEAESLVAESKTTLENEGMLHVDKAMLILSGAKHGKIDEAINEASLGLKLNQAKQPRDDTAILEALGTLSYAHLQEGTPSSIEPYVEEAISLLKGNGLLEASYGGLFAGLKSYALSKKGNNAESIDYLIDHIQSSGDGALFPLSQLAIRLAETNKSSSILLFKVLANNTLLGVERFRKKGYSVELTHNSINWVFRYLVTLLQSQGRTSEALALSDLLNKNETDTFYGITADETSKIWLSPEEEAISVRLMTLIDRIHNENLANQKGFASSNPHHKFGLQKLSLSLDSDRKELKELLLSLQNPNFSCCRTAPRELEAGLPIPEEGAIRLSYYVDRGVVRGIVQKSDASGFDYEMPIRDVDQAAKKYLASIKDPKSHYQDASKSLYKILISPVEPLLSQNGTKKIYLSLSGWLKDIPFAALYDGNSHLIERFQLTNITGHFRSKREDTSNLTGRFAIFGASSDMDGLPKLQYVSDELKGINEIAQKAGIEIRSLLDHAFSKDEFLKDITTGYSVIHIASHFVFSPGTEANSFLLLGTGEHLEIQTLGQSLQDLSHIKLLSLSACETASGGGLDSSGLEVYGLSSFFESKGVGTTLATLWPVSDESTAILMVETYRHLLIDKMTIGEALKEAQVSMLRGRLAANNYGRTLTSDSDNSWSRHKSHPFYWAPFVLSGSL